MKGVQPWQRPIPLSTFEALGWQITNRGGIGIGTYFDGTIQKPVCAHGFASMMDAEALLSLRRSRRNVVTLQQWESVGTTLQPWESVGTTLRAVNVTEGMNDARLAALYYDLLGGWPSSGQMFSWEQWRQALDITPVDMSPQDWWSAIMSGEISLAALKSRDEVWYDNYMVRRGYQKVVNFAGIMGWQKPFSVPYVGKSMVTKGFEGQVTEMIVWSDNDIKVVDLSPAETKYQKFLDQFAAYMGVMVSPHQFSLLKSLQSLHAKEERVAAAMGRFDAEVAKVNKAATNLSAAVSSMLVEDQRVKKLMASYRRGPQPEPGQIIRPQKPSPTGRFDIGGHTQREFNPGRVILDQPMFKTPVWTTTKPEYEEEFSGISGEQWSALMLNAASKGPHLPPKESYVRTVKATKLHMTAFEYPSLSDEVAREVQDLVLRQRLKILHARSSELTASFNPEIKLTSTMQYGKPNKNGLTILPPPHGARLNKAANYDLCTESPACVVGVTVEEGTVTDAMINALADVPTTPEPEKVTV